jgi:clan AA aspartic protease
MMDGTVTPSLQAIVKVVVQGSSDRPAEVEAVIDTGFTGDLTLPKGLVSALGSQSGGIFHANLGDGRRIVMNYHEAVVIWHGQPRAVEVLESDTPPLIGMSLLEGNRLTMDVIPGGRVTIRILPKMESFWRILGKLRAMIIGAGAIDQPATQLA